MAMLNSALGANKLLTLLETYWPDLIPRIKKGDRTARLYLDFRYKGRHTGEEFYGLEIYAFFDCISFEAQYHYDCVKFVFGSGNMWCAKSFENTPGDCFPFDEQKFVTKANAMIERALETERQKMEQN